MPRSSNALRLTRLRSTVMREPCLRSDLRRSLALATVNFSMRMRTTERSSPSLRFTSSRSQALSCLLIVSPDVDLDARTHRRRDDDAPEVLALRGVRLG